MKKTLILVFSLLSVAFVGAQQQISNSGFEDWEGEGYEFEPVHWSSLKTAYGQASVAPVVLEQATGRTGDYSIKLFAKKVLGTLVANGVITTGRISAESFNPEQGYVYTDVEDDRWNMPFTDRPDSLVGWYKSDLQGSDRASFEVLLHKSGKARVPRDANTINNLEVGAAKFWVEESTSEWTRFSAPFSYKNGDSPSYLLGVFAAGDSTHATDGTIIWLDDIELIYNPASVHENSLENGKIYSANGNIYFEGFDEDEIEYTITDISGRLIQQGKIISSASFASTTGIYVVTARSRNGIITRKIHFKN